MRASTTHLPSRVNVGGTRLADESVRDFHDQASSSASSTSFPFAFRRLRGFRGAWGSVGCASWASEGFRGEFCTTDAVMVRVRSTATGMVGAGDSDGSALPALSKNLPRARNGNLLGTRPGASLGSARVLLVDSSVWGKSGRKGCRRVHCSVYVCTKLLHTTSRQNKERKIEQGESMACEERMDEQGYSASGYQVHIRS